MGRFDVFVLLFLLTVNVYVTNSQHNESCSNPEVADLIFLIDGSSSIAAHHFEKVKKVIETFITKNVFGKTRMRIGVIQFSTEPHLEFQLDQYDDKAVLLKAVHQIQQSGGGTNTGQALNFTIDYFDSSKGGRPGKQQYLLLITDGESGDDVTEAARAIRDRGVNVFAIGIDAANYAELVTISGSQDKVFQVDNFDTLIDLDKWISFEAWGPNACSNPEVADVIFLIDGSSSIQPSDFVKVKHFAEALINKTEVAETGVQIGIIQFSTEPHLEFQLDQYDDKAVLLKAVHQIQQSGGGTNTGQALNFTIDYFDSSKGGRPGRQQYLILITDGESGDHVSEAARAIRDRGVDVFAIGIGAANNDQLVMISGSEANIYNIDGYGALMSLEKLISLDVCNPFAGCKRIKVADIVFVMDGSDSITAVQFKSMKDFIMNVVDHSEVDTDNVRFGAIVYGNNTQTIFQLDQFTSKAEIRNAVFGLQKMTGGSRYTAKALKEAKKLLSAENGGRPQSNPKVPQFVILVTNGPVRDSKDIPSIAEAFRNNGVGVYAIGVKGANKQELVDITGSEDNYQPALAFGFLYHLSSTVTHVLCAET
ncbi:collagen alpha-6(VI) chain-like [Scyliorhinus canicula]|uniref:collagen alpha-6(VI) chain-like n=1 Tax=Scyliorhinus canicula TaxID=7830 RepID=UPI0018F32C41|nr:collagen alpha-6(VI) chain-like [Scyliorhinus canicula]